MHQTGEFPLDFTPKDNEEENKAHKGTKAHFLICGADQTAEPNKGLLLSFSIYPFVGVFVCARVHARVHVAKLIATTPALFSLSG